MKVLLINGSAKEKGCTFTALSEVARGLNESGVETEILSLGTKPVADCMAVENAVKPVPVYLGIS